MVILLSTTEHDALQILLTIHKLALTPALRECLKPYIEEIKQIEFHGLAHLGSLTVFDEGKIIDLEYYTISPLGFNVLDTYEDLKLSDPAKKIYNKIINKEHAILQIYEEYSEMLSKEDVTGWYAEQFNIADAERNQLKDALTTEKEQHTETRRVLDNYTQILETNNLL